jgi:phosphoribosylanthranilate isomerase
MRVRTRVKFCGLVRPVDVDDAVAIGADAVGFVFYPRSPRLLTAETAAALRRRLPSFVAAVGLFVDESPEVVAHTVAIAGLDLVQLHGDETPERAAAIAAGSARPWWRAVRMRPETDLLSSAQQFGGAECLLLDAFSEGFGGSGRRFDWGWIPSGVPARLVLSGGLDDTTVGEAIARVGPFGVDVSSGIQGSDPRIKDRRRMERFVAEVMAADSKRA